VANNRTTCRLSEETLETRRGVELPRTFSRSGVRSTLALDDSDQEDKELGHLVRFQFKCSDQRKLKLLVCSLPYFSEYEPQTHEFYYRGPENREHNYDMPDAFIKIDENGLDFCAYGSGEVIGELYEKLKERVLISFGKYDELL
jgi:hypothetical protein